jgi:hypothetical protein
MSQKCLSEELIKIIFLMIFTPAIVLCKLRVFWLQAKKTPTENFQLRQIRENSKFNGNFSGSGSTIFVFDFKVPMRQFFL